MKTLVFLAALVTPVALPAWGRVIYVDATVPYGGWGLSWSEAFPYPDLALKWAAPGDEVWIARGVYPTGVVTVTGGISVYGGFEGNASETYPGGETARDQRDPVRNVTTISGDVLGDDDGFRNRTDNASHVFVLAGDKTGNPVLYGLIITNGGHGDDPLAFQDHGDGAGIRVDGGAPSIVDCVITGNAVGFFSGVYGQAGCGGGIYCADGTAPTIRNCEITGNRAGNARCSGIAQGGDGGGIYSIHAVPTIEGCLIAFNASGTAGRAGSGGGLALYLRFNLGDPVVVKDCRILSNTASDCSCTRDELLQERSGDPGDGGGVALYGDSSDNRRLVMENCAIADNRAGDGPGGGRGGGVYSMGNLTMTNCSLVRNRAGLNRYATGCVGDGHGGGLCMGGRSVVLEGCLVAGNRTGDKVNPCNPGEVVSGAGVYVLGRIRVSNCTIHGNSGGGAFGFGLGAVASKGTEVENTIAWGNGSGPSWSLNDQIYDRVLDVTLSHSCVQGLPRGWPGEDNTGEDPGFVDPFGPDGVERTGDEDLHLREDSPLVNRGGPLSAEREAGLDLEGNPRLRNGVVDIGAFECQTLPDPVRVLNVETRAEADFDRIEIDLEDVHPPVVATFLDATPSLEEPRPLGRLTLDGSSPRVVWEYRKLIRPDLYLVRFTGPDRGLVVAGPVEMPSPTPPATSWIGFPTPNPVSAYMHLSFQIGSMDFDRGSIALDARIFDVQGRLVGRFQREITGPGRSRVTWGVLDEQGHRVPPGVYYLRVQAGAATAVRSLVVTAGS